MAYNNRELLARLINCEAGGEGDDGMRAVATVVMNRVKSPEFPGNIAGVIYQPGAFDAVYDGQIKLTPEESCINAARDALNGWDPVNGALFYWNQNKSHNKWMQTLSVTKEIQNHVFALK
jgi:N-acetylmuramoyl-L-alanine amidase